MFTIYLTSVNELKPDTRADVLDSYLLRIATQDSDALASLYHETSASVYGFALSILKNTHDAEDVLHDSFVNIYSAAGSYRSTGKPMAWILAITRNLCLMKLREYKKQADIPQEDWEPYLEANPGISPEDKLVLSQCMSLLSDEERQIILLHAVAGFKHREIASLTELPLPTVLSKYNRAIKKLRKHL